MPTNGRKTRETNGKKSSQAEDLHDVEPYAAFEVEMFPSDVDSASHPYADQFRDMLEDVAREYDCQLVSFDVHKGTVNFSFDSNELTAEILRLIQGGRNG
ncbi:MAG: hypothetical protein U5R49_16355 [Deltaproteobacteria bacterium]|nr:hypothetical protein [Deltaproteobacteria bacterium]